MIKILQVLHIFSKNQSFPAYLHICIFTFPTLTTLSTANLSSCCHAVILLPLNNLSLTAHPPVIVMPLAGKNRLRTVCCIWCALLCAFLCALCAFQCLVCVLFRVFVCCRVFVCVASCGVVWFVFYMCVCIWTRLFRVCISNHVRLMWLHVHAHIWAFHQLLLPPLMCLFLLLNLNYVCIKCEHCYICWLGFHKPIHPPSYTTLATTIQKTKKKRYTHLMSQKQMYAK